MMHRHPENVNSTGRDSRPDALLTPYIEAFVKDRDRSHYAINNGIDRQWPTVKSYARDKLIARHLRDRAIVGLPFREYTDLLVLDFDNHDPARDRTKDIRRLLDRVQDQIGEGVVFRSSDSGGMHAYFHLDGVHHREDIRAFGRDLLRRVQSHRDPVGVDVFPSGNVLRLPLGKGSAYLTSTFDPIEDKREALHAALDARSLLLSESSLIRIETDRAALVREALYNSGLSRERRSKGGHSETVARLLAQGITSAGQTNEAIRYLAAHAVFYGMHADPLSAVEWTIAWMDQHHNGNSRDWSNDRDRMRVKIADHVRHFWQLRKHLSDDYRARHFVTDDDAGTIDAITAHLDDRRKARTFLYLLIGHLRRLTDEADRELDGVPVVPLAISYIQRWEGFGKRATALRYRRLAEELGIIEPIGKPGTKGQSYRVHWDFKSNSRHLTRRIFERDGRKRETAEQTKAVETIRQILDQIGTTATAQLLDVSERHVRRLVRSERPFTLPVLAKLGQIRHIAKLSTCQTDQKGNPNINSLLAVTPDGILTCNSVSVKSLDGYSA